MTQVTRLLAATLIMILIARPVWADRRASDESGKISVSHWVERPAQESMTREAEQMVISIGMILEHGEHGTRFHHEEDGKWHGFYFDRIRRKPSMRDFKCFCLKFMLGVLHIVLILVAFLHLLHS
ncbi:MAG: hypothetical protein MUE58_03630 [Chitinophagaceae bacterium]|jgi:hypothetical protein|nr:hypothetical protein [Chitinophagaceae bacterium]